VSSTFRGLRDRLRGWVPVWLQNRPGLQVGFSILYTWALVLDVALKWCVEGVYCWWPGYSLGAAPNEVDPSGTMGLVAQSRGLLQGPSESNAAFTARSIGWIDDAEASGSAEILAKQLQAFLTGAGTLGVGVRPTVRVVDRNGNWVIANPDGTITFTSAAWDWDEVSGWVDAVGFQSASTVEGYWSDLWIVIAPDPFARYTGLFADPAWLANAFQGPVAAGGGLGHDVPRVYVDGVLNLIATWKGAHTYVRAVIWAVDTTTFTPGTPTADGTYGNNLKMSGATGGDARAASGRYWIPGNG
jgi:hypothetical protein